MIHLIYGGSGSGKSSFAEDCVIKTNFSHRYYIATMKIDGEEGQMRVKRHKKQRAGKGFITVEMPYISSGDNIISSIDAYDSILLLECISNLVANEMFQGNIINSYETVAFEIIKNLKRLLSEFVNVIIVSNNVFEDGYDYDETTLCYMKCLSVVNEFISSMADKVTEVVCGIPVEVK